MIKLSTSISVEPFQEQLTSIDKTMFIGSCFTENIGQKMKGLGFQTSINPFGILYSPFSILYALDFIAENKKLTEQDLFFYNELWHSYFHHGKFSNIDKEECLRICNEEIHAAHHFLKEAKFLVITFGSAWFYMHKETGNIMANCHKMPAQTFEKKLSTVEKTEESFGKAIQKLRKSNPNLYFLFTVSPVRHWNDGYRENQVSKSILHLLIYQLQQQNEQKDIFYFPTYEILVDELRDYRFYDSDLLHPNALAIDIIWERLKQVLFSAETLQEMEQIEAFKRMYFHRPLHPQTESFCAHQQKTAQLLTELKIQKPHLNFEGILGE